MRTFLIAALLSCFLSHAQITFEKGYFVNNNGQRTECFIQNSDWENNPTSFGYKLNEADSDKKTENIMGVSEFGINNETLYKRFTVQIERSQTVTANLQNNKNPDWKTETLFLLAIVTGEANLYSYTEGNVNKYFFNVRQQPIEQLVMIKYDNGDGIGQNNQFKQQLFNNVKCEKTPEGSFRNMEYNKKSLARHFELFNTCSGSPLKDNVNYLSLEKKREVFALRFTPGIYFSSMSITDPYAYYNASVDLNQTIFRIAIEAEFFLPINKNSWSFFVNPGYQKFSPSKDYISHVNNPGFANDGDEIHFSAEADYAAVEIPVGLRHYFYLNTHSKIFIDAAYVINFSMSDPYITIDDNDGLVNAGIALPISNKNNFTFGIGYGYKKWSAQIKYYTPKDLTEFASWEAKYSSIGLNLGYRIF